MNHDIDFIGIEPQTVTINDQSVEVTPLVVSELPRMARATSGYLTQIVIMAEAGTLDVMALLDMVGEHGDKLIEAVAIGARRAPEWVGKLHPDRFGVLALMVIEANLDFFSKAVKRLQAAAPQLAPSLAGRAASAQKAGRSATPRPSTA